MRALITAIGLGANRPQDAVYPTSLKDAEGRGLRRARTSMSMHFAKDEMPPAEGFWSITMYDANYFFVANPINRYSISARQNLKRNADGSVDLHVQNDSPGRGQGVELAAGADGQVHPDDAPVLAAAKRSIDPRWQLEDPRSDQGRRLTTFWSCVTSPIRALRNKAAGNRIVSSQSLTSNRAIGVRKPFLRRSRPLVRFRRVFGARATVVLAPSSYCAYVITKFLACMLERKRRCSLNSLAWSRL